jgi:DNA processing protein
MTACTAELAARVALVTLPGLGPARAAWLLGANTAVEVVDALRSGRLPAAVGLAPFGVSSKLVRSWTKALGLVEPWRLVADVDRYGATLLGPDDPQWPFADDPDPPVVLFCRGRRELLSSSPKVALVGTRRCTALGRQVAFQFGQELALAGVTIVSGLATGIDGAAHAGTLAVGGQALGVVGTGLDVVYPGANRRLWGRVADEGLLITEAMLGVRPERWRFPARNRLMAGLADVVVVVESHDEGGSLLTAAEAADRGRPVMAVPGAITSSASVGTNRLLVDGCSPACSSRDILDLLSHQPQPPSTVSSPGVPAHQPAPPAPPLATVLSPLGRLIMAEVAAGATHIDELIGASRALVPELLAEVNRLEGLGLIRLDGSTVCRSG